MKNTNFLLLALILGCSFFLSGAVVFPSSALAGFQWVPPEASQLPSVPTIITGQSSPTQQLPPVVSGQEPELLITSPVANKKVPELPASMPAITPPASPKEEVLRGFADNIPLSVALRQILPPDYSFSVEKNVDLGTLVSWNGGKPWRPTMEEMLQKAGLVMREQGPAIRIMRVQDKGPENLVPPASTAPVSAVPAMVKEPQLAQSPIVMSERQTPVEVLPVPQVMVDGPAPQTQTAGVEMWTANRGDMLHKVLEEWSRRAGIDLSWQADYDYPLQASVTLTGTFEEAVRGILSGFQEAQPQPVANLYRGSVSGQSALVIRARGNNYSD